MKKILFSLIALLCSMSINAQVMKVMKGEEVVATFTSAQANQVVFGESTGEFTLSVELGSYASFFGESYEKDYPSTSTLICVLNRNDKKIASFHMISGPSSAFAGLIDLETASFEEKKALVLKYDASGMGKEGIDMINNSKDNFSVYRDRMPNTEYIVMVYATSEEADEYVTYVRATTAAEPLATTGTAKATIGGSEVDVNWVQLWENGPKFAEYNVGVTDGKAESYGDHYTWGGSINNDPAGAYYEGSGNLTGDNDTATKLWGENWRMPTNAELKALRNNCDVEWTTVNGVNGRKFTGKGDYASSSVFLPAAGYGRGGQGNTGYYWSSTPEGSEIADYLIFSSASQQGAVDRRSNSYSVRAVLVEE